MTKNKKSSVKRVRDVVASTPYLNSVARRAYRALFRRNSKTSSSKKGTLDVKNYAIAEGLNMTSSRILEGHATISNVCVAERLERAVQACAEEICVISFPSERGNEINLGIREQDVAVFTKIMGQCLDIDLTWGGRLEGTLQDFSDEEFVKTLRKNRKLQALITWPRGLATRLKVSLFSPGLDKTDSRDNHNRFLRHVQSGHGDFLNKPGLIPIDDLLGGCPADAANSPVDVVFTWVNKDDPEWQKLYKSVKYEPESHEADAHSPDRFTNRDELRYALRSVRQYIPWVRRIYVFTNCAPPDWLETSSELRWVNHEEVIPREYLPTFNSHAIESFLHKIPDISESFIYFNDDFFINEDLPRSYFFSTSDMPNANLEDYGTVNGDVLQSDKDYLNAARNCVSLIKTAFQRAPTRLHKHSPYALKVSFLRELEEKYPNEFERTRRAKFRSSTDISIVSFLFHHFVYLAGCGTQKGYRTQLIKNSSSSYKRDLKEMQEGTGVRTFCINDGGNSHDDEGWSREIQRFLVERFPLPIEEER